MLVPKKSVITFDELEETNSQQGQQTRNVLTFDQLEEPTQTTQPAGNIIPFDALDDSEPTLPIPDTQKLVKDQWWRDPNVANSLLQNQNVRAFLDIIATAEGTYGGERGISAEDSYKVGFNYNIIEDLSDHPRQEYRFTETDGDENITTAAGRYQFISSTWDNLKAMMSLPDFGPRSQDMAAIEIARQEGALPYILQGDMKRAIEQVNARTTQWASLPSSRANQPKRSWDDVLNNPNQTTEDNLFNRVQKLNTVKEETGQPVAVGDEDSIGDPWTRGFQAALFAGEDMFNFMDHLSARVANTLGTDRTGLFAHAANKMWGWANSVQAAPATGKYAEAPDNVLGWLDPARMYQVAAENLPLVGGFAAATMVHPGLGGAIMFGIEGGSALEDIERYEKENNVKVDETLKTTVPIMVGAFNAALEYVGLDKVMKVAGAAGLKRKLLQLAIAAPTEGLTEGAQEINSALAEVAYRGNIPEDIGERFIHAFYAGTVIGLVGGGISGVVGTAARPTGPDLVYVGSEETVTGEPLDPKFRVMKAGHPLEGQIVRINEITPDLKLPNFRRQLMKEQLLHSVEGLSELEAEASMTLVDAHAAAIGMSTEEYIQKYVAGVVRGRRVERGDILQRTEKGRALIDKALETYKSVDDINLAAFILPDGQMLDLDQGGGPIKGHEVVADIMDPNDLDPDDPYFDSASKFVYYTGSVKISRSDEKALEISVSSPITAKQRRIILREVSSRDSFLIEYEDPITGNLVWKTFTNPRVGEVGRFLDEVSAKFEQSIGDEGDLFQGAQSSYEMRDDVGEFVPIQYEMARKPPPEQGTVEDWATYLKSLNNVTKEEIEGLKTWIENRSKNTARFNGRPFWAGSVNLLDGVIEETHTYEQAAQADFRHSLYFSRPQVEKIDSGINAFFTVSADGDILDFREPIPNWVKREIKNQISQRKVGVVSKDEVLNFIRTQAPRQFFQRQGRGAKGAINFADDGRALIKAFSTADVSTIIHEFGHLFRRTMTPEQLVAVEKAIGVKDGVWDRAAEEKFARMFERFAYEGKVKHRSLRHIFQQFAEWMTEIYLNIDGSAIDLPMTKQARRAFNSILAEVMPENAGIELTRSWWEKVMDAFDVENRFKRLNQGETGFHIKNYYSVQERHTTEGIELVRYVSKKLGRNQQRIAEAILIAEDRRAIQELRRSGDQAMIDAVTALRDYFDRSLHELKRLGGLRRGFREDLIANINDKIRELEAKVKPNKKTHANLLALKEALQEARNIEFVHIPIRSWFESKVNVSPSIAILALKTLKNRRTPRIKDLVDAGILSMEDITLKEIIGSYAQRKGRDIALLQIRNAALREGAAKRRTRKETSPGYLLPPIGSSIFAGMEVNGPLHDWLDAMTRPDRLAVIRNILNTTKMAAFYNPLLLNSYNIIQLSLATGLNAANPIYWKRGVRSMLTKDKNFYRAEEEGIQSQPFRSPLEDLNRKFAAAEEGQVVAWMRDIFKESKDQKIGGVFTKFAFAPFRFIKSLYQLSWDSAWYMDRLARQVMYEYQLDQGMSEREAAQYTAKVFGDYASVPPNTRRFLNTFLFTPTYKIAMGKLFYDSIRSAGSLLAGNRTMSHKQRAAVLLRTAAIVVGYDMLMSALGWERDQFGRRYVQNVMGSGEEGTGIGPKELVTVWGGPHDLFYKIALRVFDSFGPEVENGLERWVSANKWELQPLFRVVSDIVANRGTGGQPIVFVTDSQEIKLWKRFKYGLSQLVPMLSALANLDPSQVSRAVIEENELSPQGTALFEQEYGNWRGVITGEYAFNPNLLLRPFQFVYARDIEPIRVREQVLRMRTILEQEVGARGVIDAIMRGADPEEIRQRMEEVPARVDNAVGRINRIISQLEDDYYEYPIGLDTTVLPLPLPSMEPTIRFEDLE